MPKLMLQSSRRKKEQTSLKDKTGSDAKTVVELKAATDESVELSKCRAGL